MISRRIKLNGYTLNDNGTYGAVWRVEETPYQLIQYINFQSRIHGWLFRCQVIPGHITHALDAVRAHDAIKLRAVS
jgi:hypothetical protein